MKILLIIPTLGLGGAQRILVGLANKLAVTGNQVTILTFTCENSNHFYTPNTNVNVVFASTLLGSTAKNIRLLRTPFIIRSFLMRNNMDVVLSFQDIANFATLIASIGLKVPIVVSERQDVRHYKFPSFRAFLRRLFYRFASDIVVQTEMVRAQFLKEGFNNVLVVPNHIPRNISHRETISKSAEYLKIVCAGRLEPQKDFALIVDAFSEVLELRKMCIVSIFGEGSLKLDLQSKIDENGLSNVIFLEGVSNDLSNEVSKADLFVLTSVYEGFPNVLAEAVAAGLPTLGYLSVSGVSELIEDGVTGIILDDESREPRKLGEALKFLVSSPDLLESMRKQAHIKSAEFDEDSIFDMWRSILIKA